MAIRRWHPGKLIILWIWGGAFACLMLREFLSGQVEATPGRHAIGFALGMLVLVGLTAVTWRWLGDREQRRRSYGASAKSRQRSYRSDGDS